MSASRKCGAVGPCVVCLAALVCCAVGMNTRGHAQDVIFEEDPFDNPQDFASHPHVARLGNGAALPKRRIGVMCGPFREGNLRGVVLLEVSPGSIADRLGLEPDDVIVSVNTHPVRTPDELSLALATATGPIRLRIRNCRNGSIVWLRNTFTFGGGQAAAARAEESYVEEDQGVAAGVGEEG